MHEIRTVRENLSAPSLPFTHRFIAILGKRKKDFVFFFYANRVWHSSSWFGGVQYSYVDSSKGSIRRHKNQLNRIVKQMTRHRCLFCFFSQSFFVSLSKRVGCVCVCVFERCGIRYLLTHLSYACECNWINFLFYLYINSSVCFVVVVVVGFFSSNSEPISCCSSLFVNSFSFEFNTNT